MKNILAVLTLIAISFTACTPEDKDVIDPVTVNLSTTSATEMGLSTKHKHFMINVGNSTDAEVTIQWERTETQGVTNWTYDVQGSSAASGTLTIPANSSVDVTFMIIPNGAAGVGSGTLKFYDSANQTATTQTFTYSLTTVPSYFRLAPAGFTDQSAIVSAPATDYHIWVINDNTAAVTVEWARTNESANPSAWETFVCTDLVCYPPSVITQSMTINPGDSVDFKTTIDHKGTIGSGGTTPIFWVASDSTNSATNQPLTYDVTQ